MFLHKLRIERSRSDSFRVSISQRLRANREGTFGKRDCLTQVALLLTEQGKIMECLCRFYMQESMASFADRKCLLIELFCLLNLFLFEGEGTQPVKQISYPRMFRSEPLLSDAQGSLEESLGRFIVAYLSGKICQSLERVGHICILWSPHLFPDSQGTQEERLGLHIFVLCQI